MLRLLFIFALAGMAAQTARAADIRVKAPAAPIDAGAPFSWTGLYLGINGGYSWGSSSWSDPSLGVASGNFGVDGALVGGQIGYNWQRGPVVLGGVEKRSVCVRCSGCWRAVTYTIETAIG